MYLFYTPGISISSLPLNERLSEGQVYLLSEEESKHCVRVLRLKAGDKIQLIDGIGGWYEAEITNHNAKKCETKIIEIRQEVGKRNWKLHIAIAPTKNMERLEWFVEKATEIGIDEISLIDCKNSERTIVKTERLVKVAVSAMKQSMKAYLPKINEVKSFKKFLEENKEIKSQKFIAHCHSPLSFAEGQGTRSHLKHLYIPHSGSLILIGPEGDFTMEEVKMAINLGFEEIHLGESRLRTETAALYACNTINSMNEE